MRFLASGKVKDIYDAGGSRLLFRFSDRVSAYDVKFAQEVPRKGEVLCRFAEFWFERLPVPNHFVRRESETEITVERMEMIPLECVVRGHFYGSLVSRHRAGTAALPPGADATLAARLPEPLFDPTTKSEHDEPVSREGAVRAGLVSAAQYDRLEEASLRVYGHMSQAARAAGFVLADIKLEFGILGGEITLGDSIGPDECRLWPADSFEPGRVQEAYDKQILRDWLAEGGYPEAFEAARAAGTDPAPPEIPQRIISEMTRRYVQAYERFAGRPIC